LDISLDGNVAIVTETGPVPLILLDHTVIDDTLLASGTTPLQPPGKANREQHG